MTSRQLSNVVAVLYLVGVPLVFMTEYITRRVLMHPLGLLLLLPAGVLVANLLYAGERFSKALLVLEGVFFVLWGVVCLSVYAMSVSTENGLSTLLGLLFKTIGAPTLEAEKMGWHLFVMLLVLSVCFVGICLVYAVVSRFSSHKTE